MNDSANSPLIPFRAQRCLLSVPAIKPILFEKALASDADCIMLDCEDSVADADKSRARRNVINALTAVDWDNRGKTVVVRINGIDTDHMYRDVIEIVEQAGEVIHSIMLPKANRSADIYMLEKLLQQIESQKDLARPIGIEAIIESAEAVQNLPSIAAASSRLQALHFGAGDFAASCGARTVDIGGLNEDFPGDPWHPVMQAIVLACRANGLRPIDSAYGDFKDRKGFLLAAKRAAALGFSGKWAIHPDQIPLVNQVMTPTPEEVEEAKAVLEAMDNAASNGMGAARIGGKMIDIASIKMARNIVELDRFIRSR